MVIVMHQAANTLAAFNYNEKKVEQKHAHFFYSRNTNAANAFIYTKDFRLQVLKNIEDKNHRVKNKCLHISVNPTQADLYKMSDYDLRKEMDQLMKHLGYEIQPYFIYKHEDIDRTHFHIVSTRINSGSLKKINDSNEKRKVSNFIKELEQKYNLDNSLKKSNAVNLIPNAKSSDLMASIQEVFKLLNRSNISSKQEYLDILKAFNLEIYETTKGQSVLVKDNNGNTMRHSINMSDFKERANLELMSVNKRQVDKKVEDILQTKTKQVLKELIQDYRFYTKQELRKAFLRNNLISYQISKNGNFNIYSPNDKTVVDAQFLIKKYSVRLKGFALSNDQFYAIIRDYTDQLLSEHKNLADTLIDKERSTINNGSGNNKICLIELDLGICNEFNSVVLNLKESEVNELKSAIAAHFEFLFKQVNSKSPRQDLSEFQQTSKLGYWGKLNRQFLFELVNYWRNSNYQERYNRRKIHQLNKRKKRKRF